MIKKEKGITLVVLIITVVVMLIIVSTTIFLSMDRFEVNDVREMYSDLQLLEDEVSNYYLKYGKLPILRNSENEAIKYTYTSLNFKIDSRDNANYYILDLASMGNLSLNYGQEGFKKVNTDDIYIINEASNTIYYVRGIENGGLRYHYIKKETSVLEDNIPPTKPEIKVVSGFEKSPGFYTTEVEIEIIPGKDSLSDVWYTTYSVDGKAQEYKGKIKLSQGKHTITAKTYDINNISSAEASLMLEVHVEHNFETTSQEATCTLEGKITTICKNPKCEEKYISVQEALGHIEKSFEDPATCTKAGNIKTYCLRCFGILNEETIPAKGHSIVITYDSEWSETEFRPKYVHMHKKIESCKNCKYKNEEYEWHSAKTFEGEWFGSIDSITDNGMTWTKDYGDFNSTVQFMGFRCKCTSDNVDWYQVWYEFRVDMLGNKNLITGQQAENLFSLEYDYNTGGYNFKDRWKCFSQEEALEVWSRVGYTTDCLTPGYCNDKCAHKKLDWDDASAYVVTVGGEGKDISNDPEYTPNMSYEEWLNSK